MLRQAYTDPVAHQEQYMSLECCPKSNVHGQDLMALVTLHGRTLRSPSSKNRGEGVDDGWCGRLMVPNIRAGQSIDGWFPLEQTDGSPVIGSNISYLYMAMRTCQCQRAKCVVRVSRGRCRVAYPHTQGTRHTRSVPSTQIEVTSGTSTS